MWLPEIDWFSSYLQYASNSLNLFLYQCFEKDRLYLAFAKQIFLNTSYHSRVIPLNDDFFIMSLSREAYCFCLRHLSVCLFLRICLPGPAFIFQTAGQVLIILHRVTGMIPVVRIFYSVYSFAKLQPVTYFITSSRKHKLDELSRSTTMLVFSCVMVASSYTYENFCMD